ncbi:MAG: twin-arginine translocation signal domain-containing protein [Chloroflexi bacterium]|nr:MAG: twin-arginine translocation signal domain-containing protein [Chloroflexota bacterium]
MLEVSKMDKRIDRRTFVKTAAAGSVAAAGLPLFGTSVAFAGEGDDEGGGHRKPDDASHRDDGGRHLQASRQACERRGQLRVVRPSG